MRLRNTGDNQVMNVLGLIVEYNPFHNGHLHHLQQSRELSGADGVICVMSGNFIQRGEPAMVNKWARAKMAVEAGVDLVIELPVVYAMASAEYFAFGAVSILDRLGIVESLCFGSESGELGGLNAVADVLHQEPAAYKEFLRKALEKGVSYPTARQEALAEYFSAAAGVKESMEEFMTSSNNILGIEYLKALRRFKSRIRPLTIPRIVNSYNQQELSGNISSATAIRKYIGASPEAPGNPDLKAVMPESSVQVLEEEFAGGRGPVVARDFEVLILAALRRMSVEAIKQLPYIGEGLENRIKKAAENSGSLEALIDNITTRRYTRTRIQRCLFSVITGLTEEEFSTFNRCGGPQYARVLAFNARGKELMRAISKNASIPLMVKTADFKNSCNPLLRRMLEIEAASTDLYVLGYRSSAARTAGQEFTQNIIRVL